NSGNEEVCTLGWSERGCNRNALT
ncbi:MAG: hypothetical protein K0Q60_3069, partial [Microvirga sp.]|nr:hypothetical protein [Microvirga sp.]